MRGFFARRHWLAGDLRPYSSAPVRHRRRCSSIGAALRSDWCTLLVAFLSIVGSAPLSAQETITYMYDAKGRLITVNHGSAGPNAGVTANYTYDNADNRTTLTLNTPTVAVSPSSLANGTVGSAYNQTISASGGFGSYTYSVSSGTLPAGLALGSSTGVLSGTPSTAAAYSFTVKAVDSSGNSGTQSYNVMIGSAGPITIQLASTDHNLRTAANNNGYSGSSGANYMFVVGSGVTITGSAGSGIGIDTGTWPTGSTLALQVNGIVRGGGANGGNGASYNNTTFAYTPPANGGAGGDAVQCNANIAITVASGASVQAGGGGGGGGGATNSNPAIVPGGGGGGGAPNGAGGTGGTGHLAGPAAAGSSGTTSGGGAGGGTGGIPGGAGGAYGAAGSAGTGGSLYAGGSGGAAGYAVRKNSTGCSVTNSGTVTGTVG